MQLKTFTLLIVFLSAAVLFLTPPGYTTDPDLEVWCCRDAGLLGTGPCTTEDIILAKRSRMEQPLDTQKVLRDFKGEYLAQAESYKTFDDPYETKYYTDYQKENFNTTDVSGDISKPIASDRLVLASNEQQDAAVKNFRDKVKDLKSAYVKNESDLNRKEAPYGADEDTYATGYSDHELSQSQRYSLEELNGDIRKQKIKDLQSRSAIDRSYEEAKSIRLPKGNTAKAGSEDRMPIIRTDSEIIQSLIEPEYVEKRIDLDFDEVKLSDIFLTLGKAADINVVVDPTFKSLLLDLHLKQVTLEEAFILIGNAYDLGFKRVGGSLYVTGKEKIKAENSVSKVLKLKNISVVEAEVLVKDIIDNINISEEINSIIVTGEPSKIQEVEAILYSIDRPQPQVILEAKIIEVNKDALKELGVDWSDEIRISSQEGGRPLSFGDDEDPLNSLYKIHRFQRTPIQFDTAIKMLENQNKAKILSNPRVSTLNDKEAEIFVGDRIPYTVTNVTGGVATTDVRWVEPGIRLTITPSIIEDDFVVIKVEPEVSFIFAFRGPNDEFPQVKTREATAFVRVENRRPFVLGGLLSQEDKENLFKVPFLGDIPLLGNLFSYEQHTITDTELIITITPTIVRGDM